MTCRKMMNKKADELNDDPQPYFDEMKEAWIDFVTYLAEEYFDSKILYEEDRPSLDEFYEYNEGEEFTFKDYSTWFSSEISSVCDDYADYKRDEMFDRKMEEE